MMGIDLGHPEDVPGVSTGVLRVPAIDLITREPSKRTQVLATSQTLRASSACKAKPRNADSVPYCHRRHTVAKPFHRTDDLVSRNQGSGGDGGATPHCPRNGQAAHRPH